MSLGYAPPVELGTGYETLETDKYIVRWKGFLFVRGCAAGEESAARMLAEWYRAGPDSALALAKGSFALCIFEKRSGSVWCAVDPFGLMRLFVSERVISDNFFELVRRLGASREEIDKRALAAFLRFGFYNQGRTLDRRIRFLAGNAVAYCTDKATIRVIERRLPQGHTDSANFDFDDYMADLSIALRGQKISLDLTGGLDSRLVAACLVRAGTPVEEAVTSGQDGNRDVPIAKEIAAQLGIPHFHTRHRIAGFEDRALELLHLTQGQMGILTYDHMFQIQQGRLARGMTIGIGGAGGELWKDFLWLQDFPRLAGAPDFARLYRRRFEPRSPSSVFLSPAFSGLFEAAASDYVAEMIRRFGGLQRTRAYDAVYADLRLPFLMGPAITAGIHATMPHFSPLLDRDGVNASMRWPAQLRLFSRWHRQTISRISPQVTKQRSTDGLSARSGMSAVRDAPFYLADKARRAAQKIAERLNLPNVVQHALEDPQTLAHGRGMGLSAAAMERLKAFGIISQSVTPDQLSRTALDRSLTAGLVLLHTMP